MRRLNYSLKMKCLKILKVSRLRYIDIDGVVPGSGGGGTTRRGYYYRAALNRYRGHKGGAIIFCNINGAGCGICSGDVRYQ